MLTINRSKKTPCPRNVKNIRRNNKIKSSKNSWLTGTAAWNYYAITQYILGIQPDYDGLVIDPCIPKDWNGFKVNRSFRGAMYAIEVRNPDHVCKGVKEVIVNGEPLNGNIIPFQKAGSTNQIVVIMG